MNMTSINPFPNDPDRREIWDMVMRRDFEAFLAADWSLTEADFAEEGFLGIDGRHLANPDHWRLQFPTVSTYRDEWLKQAEAFRNVELVGVSKSDFLYQTAVLRDIEINGNRALGRKKFNGTAITTTGESIKMLWQSVYFLRKEGKEWRICGFVGYLPNPMG